MAGTTPTEKEQGKALFGASNTPASAPFTDATAIGGVFSYLHQCAGMDEQTLSRTAQAIYDVLPPRDRAGFVDAATMSGLTMAPRVADYYGTDMACQSVPTRAISAPDPNCHACDGSGRIALGPDDSDECLSCTPEIPLPRAGE